ncbi:MAG: YggT family protein [Candidatus Limnocylindrales bacterium]
MTDYERTTVRETTTSDPAVPIQHATPVAAPVAAAPVQETAVRTTERAYVPAGPSGVTTAARVVTFLFGILQAALVLRIILLLLVANQGNDVVGLILGITDPFVEPFRGMFAFDRVTADSGSRFDIAALVALVGWTLVEMLILAALRIFARRPADAV